MFMRDWGAPKHLLTIMPCTHQKMVVWLYHIMLQHFGSAGHDFVCCQRCAWEEMCVSVLMPEPGMSKPMSLHT